MDSKMRVPTESDSIEYVIRFRLYWGTGSNCLQYSDAENARYSAVGKSAEANPDYEAVRNFVRYRRCTGYLGSGIGYTVATGRKPVFSTLPDGSNTLKFVAESAQYGEPILVCHHYTGAAEGGVRGEWIMYPPSGSRPTASQIERELFGSGGHGDGQEYYDAALAAHNERVPSEAVVAT